MVEKNRFESSVSHVPPDIMSEVSYVWRSCFQGLASFVRHSDRRGMVIARWAKEVAGRKFLL